jgi:Ca-activated chloride channel family protein
VNNNRSWWIWGAAVLLIVFVIAGVAGRLIDAIAQPGPTDGGGAAVPTPTTPANAIGISIASSNTKETWLHQAVDAFNTAAATDPDLQVDGKPVFVTILQEEVDGKVADYRSGTMVSDTLAGRIEPTVLSPGEESWVQKFDRDWQTAKGADPISAPQSPILVRTPLVVAMWASRAKALGCWPTPGPECTWARLGALANDPQGWASLGQPQWRKFKFGYGYFGESNSGTLATVAMCMAALGKTSGLTVADVSSDNACGLFLHEIEKAKVHSGKSDVFLLDQMQSGGPEYLDGVVTYESNVIARNRSAGDKLREPLVSVYPQDGTVVVGHPYAILDGTPWVTEDQATGARIFRDFLLSDGQQRALLDLGLRPADAATPLGTPIEPANGANPEANLVPLTVPDTLAIDRIGEVWQDVRKHASIAIVFDKSGSMAENAKINAAVKGAQEFVRKMSPQDELLWIPFDEGVYPGVQGTKAAIGEDLVGDIAGTTAEGGTALYDAILLAREKLEAERAVTGDTVRYGIVVLSDGQDQNSVQTLSQLEAALATTEADPAGIQIHTIGIGEDADVATLKAIAQAAHGRFWQPKTDADVIVVYKDIAAYF